MARSRKHERRRSNKGKRGSPYTPNTQKSKPTSQRSSPPRGRRRRRDTSNEDIDGDTDMTPPNSNRSPTTSTAIRSPQPPPPPASTPSQSCREDPAPKDCPACELMKSRAACLRDTLAALAAAQASAIGFWAGPSVVAVDQIHVEEKKTADSMDWQQDCALPVRIVTDVPELRCYPREIVRWPETPSSSS